MIKIISYVVTELSCVKANVLHRTVGGFNVLQGPTGTKQVSLVQILLIWKATCTAHASFEQLLY